MCCFNLLTHCPRCFLFLLPEMYLLRCDLSTHFSLSCFSLFCYAFCLFDLIFVISYSDYFGFPTFIPSPLSFLPWQLLPVQIKSILPGWSWGLNLGSTTRGQNKKSEKLLIPKGAVYQGQTLQKPSHWSYFSSLFAATESTNLSSLLTPYWCKACSWYWLEKPGGPLRHPALACRILEI